MSRFSSSSISCEISCSADRCRSSARSNSPAWYRDNTSAPAAAYRASIARMRSTLSRTPGPPIASIPSRSSVKLFFAISILAFHESSNVVKRHRAVVALRRDGVDRLACQVALVAELDLVVRSRVHLPDHEDARDAHRQQEHGDDQEPGQQLGVDRGADPARSDRPRVGSGVGAGPGLHRGIRGHRVSGRWAGRRSRRLGPPGRVREAWILS